MIQIKWVHLEVKTRPVYAYATNDIMQLPEEKRAEIAGRIRKAGGEIIVSDSSAEDNRKTGRRIIEKLKEEANK